MSWDPDNLKKTNKKQLQSPISNQPYVKWRNRKKNQLKKGKKNNPHQYGLTY